MFIIKNLIRLFTFTLLFAFIFSGVAEGAPPNQGMVPPNHQNGQMQQQQGVTQLKQQNGKLNEMQIKQSTELSYSSQRIELYIQKDYLTKEEIEELARRIETGLSDIEKYLDIKFENIYGKDKKITYYIRSGKFVSHVQGGWNQWKLPTPIPTIYLSLAKEKMAPYLHETVHLMNPRYSSLWIREGFAVYLNEKLSEFKSRLTDTDILSEAKENLTKDNEYPLSLVGKNGIPEIDEDEGQDAFYVFSGSFVRFIENKIGTETFMKIYVEDDTQNAILKYTNKSVDAWKLEWLDYLGAPQFLKTLYEPEHKMRNIVLQLNNPLFEVDGYRREIDPGRDTVPSLINERVYIPIKALIESMGGTVGWNEAERKISISARGTTIDLRLNNKLIKVNGKEQEIDVVPLVINDRTMVPVRFIAENLNCNVSWDGDNGKVIITFEE